MDSYHDVKVAFDYLKGHGPEVGAKLALAAAVGWGLGKIGKGLSDIAEAARQGYFQS